MSLFFRRQEQRVITDSDFWGSWASGDVNQADSTMSLENSLRMVPVFAATRLLADSVASLPIESYRKVNLTEIQPIESAALFKNPSQFGTIYEWVFRAMVSLTLRGNAFGLITAYDNTGYPLQVEWIHPNDVTLEYDDIFYPIRWFVRGRTVENFSLVHIPSYVMPGRVLGISPIRAYQMTIQTGLSAQKFGRDWFNNSSIPAGTVTTPTPLTDTQAATVKAKFKAAAANRDIVTMANGMSFDQINVPADESQFLMTLKATASQVASIYGIPPEMIGGDTVGSLTYKTEEMHQINFAMSCLRPWLVKLENHFYGLLPGKQYVRFNLDSMIRADMAQRFSSYNTALQDRWMNVNEVRTQENKPPIPGGDVYPEPAPAATLPTPTVPPPPPPSGGTQ